MKRLAKKKKSKKEKRKGSAEIQTTDLLITSQVP